MRYSSLLSYRFALMTTLGLLHACGGRTTSGSERHSDAADASADDDTDDATSDDELPTDDIDDDDLPMDDDFATDDEMPMDDDFGTDVPTDDEMPTDDDFGTDDPPTDDDSGTDVTSPPRDGGVEGGVPQPPANAQCEGAQLPLGDGLQQCASGLVHRVGVPNCDSELPREEMTVVPLPEGAVAADAGALPPLPFEYVDEATGSYYFYDCFYDSDCTASAYGSCQQGSNEGAGFSSYCSYGCAIDDDCDEGFVCECSSPAGRCVPANCATDADCPTGEACARYEYDDGCGPTVGYACTSPEDSCRFTSDCAEGYCAFEPDDGNARRCEVAECVIGRPFLVRGQDRLAVVVDRDDWVLGEWANSMPRGLDNDTHARRLAADAWARIGLMEHASIAAFARFAMQLVALGAPSSLLEATTSAMADETQHARLAFALATALGGSVVGPGCLDVAGSLDQMDLRAIVLNTVLEGCIGETVAALEARLALGETRSPQIREVLQTIERDEKRHAELAWRFVDWALRRDPSLGAEVSQLLQEERRSAHATWEAVRGSSNAEAGALARFGIVGDVERKQLRKDVLDSVVAPCLAAMVARSTSAQAQKQKDSQELTPIPMEVLS